MSTLKKNQHYVWRHYLDAWAVDERIWCYRCSEKKVFKTITRNIANERFFYGFKALTVADLFYLDKVVIGSIRSEELRDLARGYVRMFTLADRLEAALADVSLQSDSRKRLSEELERVRKTLGEEYHTGLESRCAELLAALRRGDCEFIQDQNSAIEFFHFLANQYFRTANLRQRILATPSLIPGHDFERTWTVEAYIYACNVAFTMFARCDVDLISFLHNGTTIPLITGDQPVINLLSERDKRIDFYYPLSPILAMRLSEAPEVRQRHLARHEVERFNRLMLDKAADQVYSNDEACLKALAIEP